MEPPGLLALGAAPNLNPASMLSILAKVAEGRWRKPPVEPGAELPVEGSGGSMVVGGERFENVVQSKKRRCLV